MRKELEGDGSESTKRKSVVMTKEDAISQKLAMYDEAFDFYMDRGRMPDTVPDDDLLGGFMVQAINENPQLKSPDLMWKDILKEEILKFIEAMLKLFEPVEKSYQEEKALIKAFANGGIEKKRELWPQVYGTIKQQFKPEEVNIDGYVQQFKNSDPETVFGPLTRDWDAACDNRLKEYETACIEMNKENWEQNIRECGYTDFRERKKIEKMFYRYPQMVDIVRIIGREKPQSEKEKDDTIRRYIPLLPSPPKPAVEIEEVTNGNDLQHVLPTETAILADQQTESLFYYKYAMSQLQLFANKPKQESRMKVEQTKKKEPRLEKGPIIVSIDTSGSMSGHPLSLATCLLRQLLQLAKKQRRRCYLISFSVQAQSLDLSRPGAWRKIDSFLSDCYSGGTDGNEMLKAGIKMLKTENYAMADMLIISDFIFDLPNAHVRQAMLEEHQKGTRFYGLQIGKYTHEYHSVLDEVWRIIQSV